MATGDQSNQNRPRPGAFRRPQATDPEQDALVRREEEFRRFLVSVVAPAFDELRGTFRASGREARSEVTTLPGRPAEATITVSHLGEVEFFCTIHATISPEQATVRKRRPVPLSIKSGAFTEVEDALLNHSEQQSNATAITRAEVVASVRTDYWVLRH
jgi:hypothetical protein